MNREYLRKSGSSWSSEQLEAFHVERIDDVSIDRFFLEHQPRVDDEVYRGLFQKLLSPTVRDLRRNPDDVENTFWDNPFREFFVQLSLAIANGHADDEEDDDDADSRMTGSSHENQSEINVELVLKAFVSAVSRALGNQIDEKWRIGVCQDRIPARLYIGTNPKRLPLKRALNDGAIVLNSDMKGKFRPGTTPIVSFEVKPRALGANIRYGTDQPEPFHSPGFAQEAAELLGQAFECNDRVGGWKNHDGYLLTLHGSRFRMANAMSYLRQVNSPILRGDQRLLIFRSEQHNLKYPAGREATLRLVYGLMRLIKSGLTENWYQNQRVQRVQ